MNGETLQPLLKQDRSAGGSETEDNAAPEGGEDFVRASSGGNPTNGLSKSQGEEKVIFELYRYLMLVAAMMVCLGHGSNDVANSISPLLTALEVDGDSI